MDDLANAVCDNKKQMWRNDKNSQPLLQVFEMDFDKQRYFLRMDLILSIFTFSDMQINQKSKFFLQNFDQNGKKLRNWNET